MNQNGKRVLFLIVIRMEYQRDLLTIQFLTSQFEDVQQPQPQAPHRRYNLQLPMNAHPLYYARHGRPVAGNIYCIALHFYCILIVKKGLLEDDEDESDEDELILFGRQAAVDTPDVDNMTYEVFAFPLLFYYILIPSLATSGIRRENGQRIKRSIKKRNRGLP